MKRSNGIELLKFSIEKVCKMIFLNTWEPCIPLKFLLATRLKSESFEPLIGFLAFLIQTFDQKNIIGNFTLTLKTEIIES